MQAYGYDVLEIEPNTGQDRSSSFNRTVTQHDNKTGKIRVTDRSGLAIVNPRGFSWVMHSRAEIDAYRQWLAARKGAAVPFWLPTWQHDLIMDVDLPLSMVNLSIKRIGYVKFMWASPARRYLRLMKLDGTGSCYYRKVTAAADGTTETLTLDASISVTLPATQCMVSFLQLVRLADDDPELIWHSRDVAEAVLDFKELSREVTV